jgi:hypothetical protein
MNSFPETLDTAVEQAKVAAQTALQSEALALEFAQLFADNGTRVKVMFPDTGAAALAKRNWGEKAFAVTDMGSRFTPIATQIAEEDEMFIVACPSSVEVERAEELSQLAGDRPVLFLIPQLEDVAVVGIGLSARKLRDRFIKNIYSCYYLRPLESGAILRCHPSLWQIWLEQESGYELATELTTKPMGEDLERLMLELTNPQGAESESKSMKKKVNFLGNLQKFLNALSQ